MQRDTHDIIKYGISISSELYWYYQATGRSPASEADKRAAPNY